MVNSPEMRRATKGFAGYDFGAGKLLRLFRMRPSLFRPVSAL